VTEGISVVIADDHPPTRAGIKISLEEEGISVLEEATDADSAVAAVERHRPDLALLDIHMPGGGIDAAVRICDRFPETAVVMLTVSRNDEDLFDSLRAGAAGYLLKDTDPTRLGAALKGVLAGEAAVPRLLVARLVDEFRTRGKRRLPVVGKRGVQLTSREWEVLDLMREGCTTQAMADRLFVTSATVRSHISTLLKKLDAPDRASAVRLMEEG
jgi:DNA-binding NarL/FixJ family response regulator